MQPAQSVVISHELINIRCSGGSLLGLAKFQCYSLMQGDRSCTGKILFHNGFSHTTKLISIRVPLQAGPSSAYPVLQEHVYPPAVLVQIWLQSLVPSGPHSSMSESRITRHGFILYHDLISRSYYPWMLTQIIIRTFLIIERDAKYIHKWHDDRIDLSHISLPNKRKKYTHWWFDHQFIP